MRKATGRLALCGAALMMAALRGAADPTTILDTYGNGGFYNVGGTVNNAGAVGFHGAVGSVKAPSDTQAHAAYAAQPFTVNGLPAGQSAVSGIDIVFNTQPPAGSTSHVGSLYGAIFRVPAGGAAALNSPGVTQVGSSFQFDTSGSVDQSDPLNMSFLKGNGLTELLSAVNLTAANINLTVGQSYLLVIEPKNGIGPAVNDTLLDYGLWIEQIASNVLKDNPNLTNNGGTLSNSYVSVTPAQDTYLQNSAGDGLTLQQIALGRVPQPVYFGARISVTAPVVSGATVTGRVSLEGVPDLGAISPFAPLGKFHVSFRDAGTGTEIKAADVSLTTTAGSAVGTFSVSGVPAGTYNVVVKGMKNLAAQPLVNGQPVTVAVSATSGAIPLVNLPAGDSDNNNSVDSSDFGTLIGAFGSDGSIPGGGYDPTVDFDFNGLVDSSDFGLLIGEFNNTGAN